MVKHNVDIRVAGPTESLATFVRRVEECLDYKADEGWELVSTCALGHQEAAVMVVLRRDRS